MITKIRVLFLCLLAIIPLAQLVSQEGRITYVEGDVSILRNGNRMEADFGSGIRPGDIVSTGVDSFTIISIPNRGELKLREDSILEITHIEPGLTRSELRRGGVFSRVRRLVSGNPWRVETASVVAAVRGTEFFVAIGGDASEGSDVWLCVNEGSVAVAVPETGEDVIVDAGLGVNILGGTDLSEPQVYEWTKNLNWNTDPSEGPVADRTNFSGLNYRPRPGMGR